MNPPSHRFREQKDGFRQVLSDPHWFAKIMLGGFLLINPFLIALTPSFFSDHGPAWVHEIFPWILGFNFLSFWFPLGFTYEVLRRARTGRGGQLPDWRWDLLATFAYEGSVKLVLAVFTLLLPAAIWMTACYAVFVHTLGLPPTLLTLFLPPIIVVVIPFCGVACCRWLDGASVLNAALNYRENVRLFLLAWPDYLIASAFIVGINSITTAFFYTIPFGAVFGLCVVDTWFGPIYAATVGETKRNSTGKRRTESAFA